MQREFARQFTARRPTTHPNSHKRSARRHRSLEQLEARQLMHGGGLDPGQLAALMAAETHHDDVPAEVATLNAGQTGNAFGPGAMAGGTSVRGDVFSKLSGVLYNPPVDPKLRDQVMGMPVLNSNPGAPVTLYLDFNGNFESDWYYIENGVQTHFANVSTPVFSTDVDQFTFNASEQAMIREIWARVAEDFAPFNINVSTAYYGGFANGQALHVVIGGDPDDWLKMDSSGYASIGSFSDNAPNTVFVFDLVTWANAGVTEEGRALNAAAAIATTASHEAGHAFGLRHHAQYGPGGVLITNYNPGTPQWTPIMGNNLASDRTTWEAGQTDLGPGTMQRDMDVLSSAANGYGYRPDDHGNTIGSASLLTSGPAIGPLTGKGIIGTMPDIDAFKFSSGGGVTQFKVTGAQYGANLMPIVEVWSAKGLVARAGSNGAIQVTLNVTLSTGTYYVLVRGYGDYGGVGQYTLTVTPKFVLSKNTLLFATLASANQSTSPTTPTGALATTTLFVQGGAPTTNRGAGSDSTLHVIPAEQTLPKLLPTTTRPTATHAVKDAVFAVVDWNVELGPSRLVDDAAIFGSLRSKFATK
jgi:hypothetical protein